MNSLQLRELIKIKLPFETNPVSQFFGENPVFYGQWNMSGHNGIDFDKNLGTPIWAVCDGIIFEAHLDEVGYGNYVGQYSDPISWDNNKIKLDVVYGHQQKVNVVIGQKVKKGDIIGWVDSTGISTGDHLHLGVRVRNKDNQVLDYNNGYLGYIDPYPLFEDKISWTVYKKWKQKMKMEIPEYENLPVENKYGQDIIDYEMFKILPWTSWAWLLLRVKRFPTYKELIALTIGHWGYEEVFKNKIGDWWTYYTKSEYNQRIKNKLGL